MFVNKIKIRYDKIGTGVTINIPIDLTFTPIDNSELIEDGFVEKEKEKSINPIVDFKKVRFRPAKLISDNWELIDEFKIQNVFLTTDSSGGIDYTTDIPSTYSAIGFSDDDLFCRYNRLMRSYMVMSFYNSPNNQSNILLYFNTLYTQISEDQKFSTGLVLPSNEAPISYVLGDPILKPNKESEGFFLYWYKDLVDNAPNKEYEMYMSVTYNNANDGSSTAMYTVPTSQETLNDTTPNPLLVVGAGLLFVKVILKYDETDNIYKYRYEKLTSPIEQTGVEWNVTGTPTITFYQLSSDL